MNKKDIIEREYFRRNEKFASIFNYYLFDGKNVIKEDELEELDTTLITTNPILSKRERDIYKKAVFKTDGKKKYLLLGIENQTREDSYMVIRNMGYDYYSYHNQVQNIEKEYKNDKIEVKRIYPVITLVIYYSHKRWTGKKDLYSIIDISDNLKEYVSNYKLNIIEPYSMEERDFDKLNNDLGLLFGFIKYSGNQTKLDLLLRNNDKYKTVDIKTARLIKEVTNIDIEINEEDGGEYNMCKAIEDMKKTARKEGKEEAKKEMCKAIEDMKKTARKEGKAEGKAENLQENIKTMNKNGADESLIAKLLGLDVAYVKKVLS